MQERLSSRSRKLHIPHVLMEKLAILILRLGCLIAYSWSDILANSGINVEKTDVNVILLQVSVYKVAMFLPCFGDGSKLVATMGRMENIQEKRERKI